MTNYQVTLNFI